MRKQLFYRCLLWLAIWAGNIGINRAQSVVLTLGETIELAADSSLEAFRTRNLYLSRRRNIITTSRGATTRRRI